MGSYDRWADFYDLQVSPKWSSCWRERPRAGAIYGDYDAGPYEKDSPPMIFVLER